MRDHRSTRRRPGRSLHGEVGQSANGEVIAIGDIRHSARERDALIIRFLPLARKVARGYRLAGGQSDDLAQVACLGLVKAAMRYDETRGASFATYARCVITNELGHYLRANAWAVHVPHGLQDRAMEVHRAVSDQCERGPAPGARDLAARLGRSEHEVLEALQATAAFSANSLDAPACNGDDPEQQALIDTVGAIDPGYGRADDRLTMLAAIRTLPVRERELLRMRFAEDRTQAEIAARIGVSQMQVSRLLRRLLESLEAIVAHPASSAPVTFAA